MTGINRLFTFGDRLQMEALNQRAEKARVISSNVANAETPGFRALGYDFEDQLRTIAGANDAMPMRATRPDHLVHSFAEADGTIQPDVFIRPTETIPQDGNTVDLDQEMGDLAKNDILYRTAIEAINRKIGLLRYAISGGFR